MTETKIERTTTEELLLACRAALVTLSDDDLYQRTRETRKTLEAAIAKAETEKNNEAK
jgi:hypothetical protein